MNYQQFQVPLSSGYRYFSVCCIGDHDSLLHFVHGDDEDDVHGSRKANMANVKQVQMQLQQTQQLADWYREQCIGQDEQVSQLKEESTVFVAYLLF